MNTLPKEFIDFTAKYPQLEILGESLLTPTETSIRINRAKTDAETTVVDNDGMVEWCNDGFYLKERTRFTFDPCLHQGLYYVQDASSMAIAAAIQQIRLDSPVKYLDACAAPGGKTTAALAALPAGSCVVANEYDPKRVWILAENIAKWGNPNVMVSQGNTSKISKLKKSFDIIAVDAPCSGEGMMRKDSAAVDQWSPALVKQCATLQREILTNVWKALRDGGYLIYSTCTFNLEENEDNVKWLMDEYGAEPVIINILESIPEVCKGIGVDFPCYRFIPGRIRGEGLFMCLLRKPGSEINEKISGKTRKNDNKNRDVSKYFNIDTEIVEKGNKLYALPKENAAFMMNAASILDTVSCGVEVGEIKGKDIIPSQALALCNVLKREVFPQVEVDQTTALSYLRKDTVTLPDGTPRGYVLLMYLGKPLGFVKHLGNRTNNLYPKTWRILSQNSAVTQPLLRQVQDRS